MQKILFFKSSLKNVGSYGRIPQPFSMKGTKYHPGWQKRSEKLLMFSRRSSGIITFTFFICVKAVIKLKTVDSLESFALILCNVTLSLILKI